MMNLEIPTVSGQFFGGTILAKSLFSDLRGSEKHSLSQITVLSHFDKDSTIVKENQLPRIFVHCEGRAESIIFNRINRRFNFQSVQRHEILGLVESISDTPFRMKVRAITPCVFQTIDKTKFIDFLRSNPSVSFSLAKLLGTDVCRNSLFFASATFPDRPSAHLH